MALLIDDDPVDLASLCGLLRSWSWDVATVRSGREALGQLAQMTVDVVVSDVVMPGMTGEEVVTRVARECPGLPVVLITGRADVRSAVRAMKLGAFDYVIKPPDIDEFRLVLERALEHARLRRENAYLRAELAAGGAYGERLVGTSAAISRVYDTIRRAAPTDSTVLITGETGTGKELVAHTLHMLSRRAARPMLVLNCAALNANLIESELFGHEKGAFTGAVTARRGRFEEADGGTLFLDEISETTPEFQAKLLRVLQTGEFQRVGGNATLRADVRILASSNRSLEDEIARGAFRRDLYYRIGVIPIHIPALRERREDIPLLAAHFLARYRERYGHPAMTLSPAALETLASRDWPGNVRELQHELERAVVLARGPCLEPGDFPRREGARGADANTDDKADDTLQAALDRCTQQHVLAVLDRLGWRKGRVAEALGIDRATLYRIMARLNIGQRKGTTL